MYPQGFAVYNTLDFTENSAMQTDPAAKEARDRLGPELTSAIHLYTLTSAVRALLAAHPEPERVRSTFDFLHAQILAHQVFLLEEDMKIVANDMAETIFQPPVELDTDH